MNITVNSYVQTLRCKEVLPSYHWDNEKKSRGAKRTGPPTKSEISTTKKIRFIIQKGKIVRKNSIRNPQFLELFNQLPNELQGRIFSLVDPCVTRLVCRRWREISHLHASYFIVSRLEGYLGEDTCQSVYQHYLSHDPKRKLSYQDRLELLFRDQRKRLFFLLGKYHAISLLKQQSPQAGFHETQFVAIEQWIRDYNLISLFIVYNDSNRILQQGLEQRFMLQDFNIGGLATTLRQASKVHFYVSPVESEIFFTRCLTEVPLEITTFTHLKDLYLTDGRMFTLSPVIAKIKTLEKLYVCNSQLRTIPQEIGQLTRLRQLFLAGNNLTKLPEAVKELTQMEILDISRNQFTEVPDEVRFLAKLKILKLAHNPLTCPPSFVSQFTTLREIHIDGTQLPSVQAEQD